MSKQYLQTLTIPNAHPTDILSLAVTPSHLLTASGSAHIKVYSTKGQTIYTESAEDENPYPLLQTLESAHRTGCHHICVSLDGKVAASVGFSGDLKIWECNEDGKWTQKGQVRITGKGAGDHWAPALNESGQYLACTTSDGRVNVYDTSTLSADSSSADTITTYETKGSFGLSVDISPNGEMTASGHHNGSIYIFNNGTRRLAHSLSSLVKAVRTVKFSPANRYLAAAGDARIIALYDTSSGEQVATFTGHASWIMSLDWNWSGEFLASAAYDGKVKVWGIEGRMCVATQTESEESLWAVKWLFRAANARNEVFVTAGAGKTLAFYREASGS